MSEKTNARLIVFSGPSCVGKSSLAKALARLHPELDNLLQPLVLYNSRRARPGETDGIDYYFRTLHEIEQLKNKQGFIIMDVRGDLQALDLDELQLLLTKGDVLFEGNPFIGQILLTHPSLMKVNRLSIFMSPVSRAEILFLKSVKPEISLPDIVTDIMRRKLLRRTRRQKGEISLEDLENIEKRASSAYSELTTAYSYQYVIPNHDGEDSENWDAYYYPLGDARLALKAFICLLKGESATGAENWEKGLIS